jgi:hypothetical protein
MLAVTISIEFELFVNLYMPQINMNMAETHCSEVFTYALENLTETRDEHFYVPTTGSGFTFRRQFLNLNQSPIRHTSQKSLFRGRSIPPRHIPSSHQASLCTLGVSSQISDHIFDFQLPRSNERRGNGLHKYGVMVDVFYGVYSNVFIRHKEEMGYVLFSFAMTLVRFLGESYYLVMKLQIVV